MANFHKLSMKSEGPMTAGSRFDLFVVYHGKLRDSIQSMAYTVLEKDDTHMKSTILHTEAVFVETYDFVPGPSADKTELNYIFEYRMRHIFNLFGPMAHYFANKHVTEHMAGIKKAEGIV